MSRINAPQRALHTFLLTYHRAGLTEREVNTLPLAAGCDMRRLVEAGCVEVRYVPVFPSEDQAPEGGGGQ